MVEIKLSFFLEIEVIVAIIWNNSPEIVVNVGIKNIPECSALLFDPSHFGQILFCRDRGDYMKTGGALLSIKNSGIFETEANGMEISLESFCKILKLLNFRECEPFNRNQMARKFPVRNL